MLLLNNLNLPLDADFSDLKPYVAKFLKINLADIKSAKLHKKSVDARHKNDIRFCCSVLAEITNEFAVLKKTKNVALYEPKNYIWRKADKKPEFSPVVVGFGPAGMFCALTLARAGLCPIVLERGKDADSRTADVNEFFSGGKLNPESNVQFGEGGAGTFSDGKLNTGIKDYRIKAVLEEFVKHGANENILTDAKPHIGTDILVNIVKSIRNEIISLGGKVYFETRLDDIKIEDGKLVSLIASGNEIFADCLCLATGHSARDTFSMLNGKNIEMIKKAFSIGVRIEHLQQDINKALYGKSYNHPSLGAADYKLAVHLPNCRGVYTFCMCPGGEVINASSEENGIAVNGMSNSKRDGINANSAVLVSIEPSDLPEDLFSGCALQKEIESKAYNIGKGKVPIETVGSFVYNKPFKITKVKPTVKPDYINANFNDIFPEFVLESLREGIKLFDRKISGFADESAVLTAPETRSSSPIRIVRNEEGMSVSLRGLFPCGEGAGYAGGIMSAATDGIKTAEAIIDFLSKPNING